MFRACVEGYIPYVNCLQVHTLINDKMRVLRLGSGKVVVALRTAQVVKCKEHPLYGFT